MKKILVLDGGGAKGIIITYLLLLLEKELGVPLYNFFDLIVGSSVGGIIGGSLSTGLLTAEKLHYLMMKNTPKVFTTKDFWIPFLMSKYSTIEFDNSFNEIFGNNFKMNQCKTYFMCTSINKINVKTHYFKSWEEKDGDLYLSDVIKRTYAAPYYFSSIHENGNVWLDGGMGNARCPLIESVIESIRQKWLQNEPVNILSLGTGYSGLEMSYKDAIKYGQLGDILFYMNPIEGGLARKQSANFQVTLCDLLEDLITNFSFQRIDKEIDKEIDKMDAVEYLKKYEKIGEELFKQININLLINGR